MSERNLSSRVAAELTRLAAQHQPPWNDASSERTGTMTALPQGYQVKARDHDGNVHDERWTTSPETARSVLGALGSDPLVAEAWTEPALPEAVQR